MLGAILGDMIGAPYEFDRGGKTKDFPLFGEGTKFTDDTVMTIAVAEALMDSMGGDDDEIKAAVTASMRKWGRKYPDAGYGGMFSKWLRARSPKPYGSFGNGSAMRVSAAGWIFDTIEETRRCARLTAEVTHNHPEGIKGAEAAASAVFLARNGCSKEEIKEYIVGEFGYDLSRTCDEIRPGYHHVESCQETVPEAVTAFLEASNFEDVIRTAVSLGGDCDTLTCIAGGIAEAFYGVPYEMMMEGRSRLPEDMAEVLFRFEDTVFPATDEMPDNSFLEGNEVIEEAIGRYYEEPDNDNLFGVLGAIRNRMHEEGHFIFPVIFSKDDSGSFSFQVIQDGEGKLWQAAFTSHEEYKKGEPSAIISDFMFSAMKANLNFDCEGIVINPWGQSFMLAKELTNMIFEADGDEEYFVPDDPVTPEILEDGSYLKNTVEIWNRNSTNMNTIRLIRILLNSNVWVPCRAIMSDFDYSELEKAVRAAENGEGLDSLVGKEFTTEDNVRLVPDILNNDEEYFFPVFSSEEEMGEYGNEFSKVEMSFFEAVNMAKNSDKELDGIVINAFSAPCVFYKELFDLVVMMAVDNEHAE